MEIERLHGGRFIPTNGPMNTKDQLGRRAYGLDQCEVDPFVHRAIETEDGAAQARHLLRDGGIGVQRAAKVSGVHATGETLRIGPEKRLAAWMLRPP